jgi:hypothetical protein
MPTGLVLPCLTDVPTGPALLSAGPVQQYFHVSAESSEFVFMALRIVQSFVHSRRGCALHVGQER